MILFVCELLHVLDRDILGIFIYTVFKIVLAFPFPWGCETCPQNFPTSCFFLVLHLSLPTSTSSDQLLLLAIDWATIRTKETTQTFNSYGVERNSFLLQQMLIHIYWLASLWMLWWACLSGKITWSSLRSQYLWFQLGI